MMASHPMASTPEAGPDHPPIAIVATIAVEGGVVARIRIGRGGGLLHDLAHDRQLLEGGHPVLPGGARRLLLDGVMAGGPLPPLPGPGPPPPGRDPPARSPPQPPPAPPAGRGGPTGGPRGGH